MTKEHFVDRAQHLKKSYDISVRDLAMEYVTEMNPYSEGDVIRDRHGSGAIVNLLVRWYCQLPEPLYKVMELNDAGYPWNKISYRFICWNDMKERRLARNEVL